MYIMWRGPQTVWANPSNNESLSMCVRHLPWGLDSMPAIVMNVDKGSDAQVLCLKPALGGEDEA